MPERTVIGRYRLTGPLGRGGMGAVWRAHDTLLGRDVAIKEIWLPSAGDEPVDPADPLVRRALREAQAAARLRHPGIVTVYDVVTDQGRPWIVMELINGRSLAEAIREHGLLTEQRTAEIGLQVLDALRAAHREGIAHRDVKPGNILLDTDRVVLTDFGIAAIDDATALTVTGQMVGSPAYMAPERINGQPATAAADLWALGVTLYSAVTGRSPFQREDTQATLAAILNSQPVTPAHAGQLWPIIKGLLVKDPASRLGTEPARQLLAKVARPAGAADAGAPAARRRPRWWPAAQGRPQSSTLDSGLPGTLAAPPPTLAAPTAFQEPEAAAVPSPRPAGPGETVGTEAGVAETAAADTAGAGADTVAADTATADTATAETAGADTVAADTVAAAAVAATAETAAAVAATADTAPAATAGAGKVTGEIGAAEIVTADTVAAETAAASTAARTVAADTAMPPASGLAPSVPALPAVTVTPLAPYPDVLVQPRTVRTRTVWLAGLAVAVLLLVAGGVLRAGHWFGNDRAGDSGSVAASGAARHSGAGGPSVKAAASPSTPVNPSLDPCLVGTWRMTSTQIVNHFDGVDALFTGKGGVITRIWPDGRGTDDYNRSAPMTAKIKSARFVETLRGVSKYHNETRNGHLYTSEFSGGPTYKVTRNGRVQSIEVHENASNDLPYICSETRLTTYGNEKYSTQSFQRVSHTP